MKTRIYSAAMAVTLGSGALFAGALPAAAQRNRSSSSERNYRIATYALGGLTAYGLVKKKGTLAVVGAAGTYLAHRKWKGEVEDRHRRTGRRR